MEKPLSFHHFHWRGHGARLSSSRFGWQSRGRGSLRLSFVPWAELKYGGFGWWPWRLLTFFCLIWWGHKVYMHNEWNISAGIHMYVVHTCILYTSLHWWIFIYIYIPFIHRHAHNPVNNKSPKSGVFAYDSKAKNVSHFLADIWGRDMVSVKPMDCTTVLGNPSWVWKPWRKTKSIYCPYVDVWKKHRRLWKPKGMSL